MMFDAYFDFCLPIVDHIVGHLEIMITQVRSMYPLGPVEKRLLRTCPNCRDENSCDFARHSCSRLVLLTQEDFVSCHTFFGIRVALRDIAVTRRFLLPLGRGGGGGGYGFRRQNNSGGDVEILRDAVFIQNLPKDVTREQIFDVFSTVGNIKVKRCSESPGRLISWAFV